MTEMLTAGTTPVSLAAARLDAIRQREQAATPGPWRWYGNTDIHSIYLATRRWGAHFVMQFRRWGMQGAAPVFCAGRTWTGTDGDLDFRYDRSPPAHQMPVFEVAPAATARDDDRVYRADLTGVRHPDAEFIASSRQDIADLLRVAEAVRALCQDSDGGWLSPAAEVPVGEFQAALGQLCPEVRRGA